MPGYHSYTDSELAGLIKQEDQLAYTELFDRYKGVLYSHAYRLLEDHDEAEDVIQDVFLTLWQKRMELEISGTLSSYLYVAVRNRIFKLFARKKVAQRYSASLQKFKGEDHNYTEEKLLERELAAIIEREVEALPEKMREVFLLTRDNTRSYKEIGAQLEISEKTVRNQVYNALQLLKVKINFFIAFLFL
ncbi:MAG TPA: RNA polymerase sigma-70 factor [Sphingobacteriaceae bacterium]